MKLRAYITHKNAEKYSDCADYFGICLQQKKVAVSDGVSQSIMPLEWAKILVAEFLNGTWDPCKDILPLQKKWYEQAEAYLNKQRSLGKNPWMLENCITNRDGAGATFCGITFNDETHWEAKILGDSCLVLLEDNNILEIISSKDGKFDNRPDYFDSFKEKRGNVKTKKGDLKSNQCLLLVSDPFSELFQNVRNTEKEKIIVEKILSLKDYEEYLKLVDEFRDSYHMHNDDSTLIIIEHDGSDIFSIDDELIPLESHQDNETKQETEIEAKQKQEKEKEIEEKLWNEVKNNNVKESYEEYLSKYPKGKYSSDAVCCISNLNNKSSESAHGNGQEEPSEPTSEDPDRCRQSDIFSKTSTSCDGHLGKDETNNIAVSAVSTGNSVENMCSSTSEATKNDYESEGTEESFEQTAHNNSAAKNTGKTKSTESTDSTGAALEYTGTATIGPTESTGSTEATKCRNSGYKEEMASQIKSQGIGVMSDPSIKQTSYVLIDIEEFDCLCSASFDLLSKHFPYLKEASDKRKWRDNPEKCFEDFWLELKKIIYKNHG